MSMVVLLVATTAIPQATITAMKSSNIRGGDIACRYGGEEFLIILVDAALQFAHQRAEALKEQVRNMQIHHRGQMLHQVTVSIGVAGFPDHGTSAQQIINLADKALYKAKTSGRNRVVLAHAALDGEGVSETPVVERGGY